MTEDNVTINPVTGRRILVPENQVMRKRPIVSTNSPLPDSGSNRLILDSNQENNTRVDNSMNNKSFAQELKELHLSLINDNKTNSASVAAMPSPTPKQVVEQQPVVAEGREVLPKQRVISSSSYQRITHQPVEMSIA